MTSETREKINRASIIIDNAMYCDEDKSLRVIGRLYYGGKEYGVGIIEAKEKSDPLDIKTPETCLNKTEHPSQHINVDSNINGSQ